METGPMMIRTGGRVNEIAAARWPEFDLERDRLWVIPATRFKMNSEHRVPLTDAMVQLLTALPRWATTDFLFSVSGTIVFNGFSTNKYRFDRRALRTWRALGRLADPLSRDRWRYSESGGGFARARTDRAGTASLYRPILYSEDVGPE
jgi:integrase